MEAGERAENLERQAEEAEALAAIYGDDLSLIHISEPTRPY